MGYIKKKEGNLLVPKALFNGHWQTRSNEQEKEIKHAVGEDNVVFLPDHENTHNTQNRRDIWIGHGAVASVLIVFCGLFVVHNMKDIGEEGDRGLASDPLSSVEIEEDGQRAIDNNIVADLNNGRRELSSINEASLENREYFEHTLLNSYYVSFDADGVLSEVQLRPEKAPIYIKDHKEFIQKNGAFFPEHSQIQNMKEDFDLDEGLKAFIYRLTGPSNVSDVSFQTDEQGMLISVIIENQE